MNIRTKGNRIALTVSLAATVFLTACASGVENFARDSLLSIKTESPRKVTLSVSGIYQKGENVEVTGRVWRHRSSPAGLYSGHVDVEITNPITGALEAYGPMVQKVTGGQVQNMITIFEIQHGHYPDYDEFMRRLVG